MVYRRIDFNEEISELKKYTVCTWSGTEQKHLIVTLENKDGEKHNRRYHFTNKNEYSRFIRELRRLEV